MARKSQALPATHITVEDWELGVIADAVYFTAFTNKGPHDRRRYEMGVVAAGNARLAYAQCAAQGARWAQELGKPSLIYAVNADGRSALVTPALAKAAGLA